MAPSKYRGAFNVAFQICVSIGYNSATLINYGTVRIAGGWGWRISIAMAGVPAAVLAFGALFLPETPNSLIQNELDDLIEASHASKAIKHPFKNLMRRKYRPQLVMSVLIPFFQQITGINIIAFYAPILFLTIGTGENASLLSATVTGIVSSSFTVITVVLVDKIGRRPLFHFGGMLSWGPLGWVVTSEIFPLEIRSAAQSIVVAVNLSMTFIIAQVFLAMLCHLKSAIFFFFAAWVLVMSVFVYFFLPETKNIPIEKMDQIWAQHFFWKRFVVDGGQSHGDVKVIVGA
ncbi:hexose carrier protein hex6 [Phtheirospermum japonicum]|uniref:Hexose carrier protein hex6 n=1 Tax=Phtheirospermum japonicum TaxID=374723 RepID=A0A830D591_9LAMI|nr:hexose carrier protein hex6 [Phtheirospermum japonicum]